MGNKHKEKLAAMTLELEVLLTAFDEMEVENYRLRSAIDNLGKVVKNQEDEISCLKEEAGIFGPFDDANTLRAEVNRLSNIVTEISDAITAFVDNNEHSRFFHTLCSDPRIRYGVVVNQSDLAFFIDNILDRAQCLDSLISSFENHVHEIDAEYDFLEEC